MAVESQRRAPGIRFEVTSPPTVEALPRMDIAAFVGFASSGPLHVPVAIEDLASFRAVFGGRVRLAWDPERSAWQYGMLDAAVEQFFVNGGRRCWVVRVAGDAASANRFSIPGLAAFGADGELAPVVVEARSEGSWSDGVQAGAALLSDAFAAGAAKKALPSGWELRLVHQPRRPVRRGDLIRLSWDETGILAFVDHVDERGDAPVLRIGSRVFGFRKPPDGVVDGIGGAALFDGSEVAVMVGEVSVADDVFEVLLPGLSASPREGGALRLNVGDSRIWITIGAVRQTSDGVVVKGEGLWLLRSVSTLPIGTPFAERLRWEFSGQIDAATRAVRPEMSFELSKEELPTDGARFRGAAALGTPPLFPFAMGDKSAPVTCLPAGIGVRRQFLGCVTPRIPALERDGLGSFSSALFLDPKLHGVSAATLIDRAEFHRYTGPNPSALRGLHSLLSIEEIALIAAPDAALRAWENAGQAPMRPPRAAEPAPALNRDRFTRCDRRTLGTPAITVAPPDQQGATVLSWTEVEGARYTVTESGDPDFSGETVIYEGTVASTRVAPRLPGDIYYRVRAAVGPSVSGWSAGVGVRVLGDASYRVLPDYSNETMIEVQRAMLRMCGARADVMAALSFPSHFDERACIAHARQLRRTRADEANTLSFGCFYHPWLIQRTAAGEFVSTPPDGAVAGLWARRTLARGAWIAPANETLRGPAGLTPALSRAYGLDLLTAQINEIRHDSRGFLVLSEDTLSGDKDLRPIHVRRLMILLRRVVLREGNRYTFEPHSLQFRRLVRRTLEGILDEMYERGAFSGKTRGTSFQVVIDDGPNALTSIDAGRLVCEVRVAPAQALAFLTVRLMQTGGGVTVEGV